MRKANLMISIILIIILIVPSHYTNSTPNQMIKPSKTISDDGSEKTIFQVVVANIHSKDLKMINRVYTTSIEDRVFVTINISHYNSNNVNNASLAIFPVYSDLTSSIQIRSNSESVRMLSDKTDDVINVIPNSLEQLQIKSYNTYQYNFSMKIGFSGQWDIFYIIEYENWSQSDKFMEIVIENGDPTTVKASLLLFNIIVCLLISQIFIHFNKKFRN